jgi:hypothetical protein
MTLPAPIFGSALEELILKHASINWSNTSMPNSNRKEEI